MNLEKNNNSRIIYRIARSNLTAKRMSSIFSMLSIFLAVMLVSTVILFLTGQDTIEKNMLGSMQHVMYMNVTEEQMQEISSDDKVELMVPYKHCGTNFVTDGVKFQLYYSESYGEKIKTYVPVEGRTPEEFNEIVVDKAFMKAMGKECTLDASLVLDLNDEVQEFIICGYTDDQYSLVTHPVRVSKKFVEQSSMMQALPYTALARIHGASDMTMSLFENAVYQIALDYGIERPDVNINGKFEQSLLDGNSGLYIILLISILIAGASGIVTYSIFYLSVKSRVRQIGQLQTIGMTEKQIKKMIRREGLLLSAIAVPAGLILSGIISYLMLPDGWSFVNYGMVVLSVGIFSVIVVQLSIGKPASIAAKTTPIEASRDMPENGNEKICREHKRLTPCRLGRMEMRRDRKRWCMTTASLVLGGILFMVAAAWIASWDEEAFSRQDEFKNGEFYIGYQYDHEKPKTYGSTELQMTGHLGRELQEKILKLPHVKGIEVYQMVQGNIEYQGTTFSQGFSPLTAESKELFQMDAEGNNSYEYLAENDAILVTSSTFSEDINGVSFQPGEKLTFHYFDGEEHTVELEIGAVSTEVVSTSGAVSNFFMSDTTMKKLWKDMDTTSTITISVDDYTKNGDEVESELKTILDHYNDLDFHTLREKRLEDSKQVQKLELQIYGISIFVIIFSLFNLINTVISSIVIRKRELSMLESVGMEEGQICRMLFWENILLVLPNILLTLTVGTAAGYGVISFMKKSASYLEYQFPVTAMILYSIGMLSIPLIISFISIKIQNKNSLVERIRTDD